MTVLQLKRTFQLCREEKFRNVSKTVAVGGKADILL